ncbi:MAG: hypothetical protein DMG62_03795 [Acidobacteria bacterium]|nr:MAG: hypothetical protein DMG62_03795 [Acidobacteriota bacterium]
MQIAGARFVQSGRRRAESHLLSAVPHSSAPQAATPMFTFRRTCSELNNLESESVYQFQLELSAESDLSGFSY